MSGDFVDVHVQKVELHHSTPGFKKGLNGLPNGFSHVSEACGFRIVGVLVFLDLPFSLEYEDVLFSLETTQLVDDRGVHDLLNIRRIVPDYFLTVEQFPDLDADVLTDIVGVQPILLRIVFLDVDTNEPREPAQQVFELKVLRISGSHLCFGLSYEIPAGMATHK